MRLGTRFQYTYQTRARVHIVTALRPPGSSNYAVEDGHRIGQAACGVVANDGQADWVPQGDDDAPLAPVTCARCLKQLR